MMMTASRVRQIGWGFVLGVCIAAFAVLSLTVHAVRSEVMVADGTIARLEARKARLQTEFQARASQRQLARWNRVELGFVAPRADQYMQAGKQLAKLASPAKRGAPTPIQIARAGDAGPTGRAAQSRVMVSPLTGEPITFASVNVPQGASSALGATLGDFLSEASPIGEAKAQSATTTHLAEAAE